MDKFHDTFTEQLKPNWGSPEATRNLQQATEFIEETTARTSETPMGHLEPAQESLEKRLTKA